jgi:hypothetical protein
VKRLAVTLALAGIGLAGGALAETRPVLDYRDQAFSTREPRYSPSERARLDRAMAEQAPASLRDEIGRTFVVLGDAAGAFSRQGARERIYLVQASRPVAIDPFPKAAAPVLVLLGEDAPARFFRLPADIRYQRLVAAADADRDGRSEVLHESTFMNMGEVATAVTAVRLDPDRASAAPVQILRDVFMDRCDLGAGRRARSAATVSLGEGGAFATRLYALGCR